LSTEQTSPKEPTEQKSSTVPNQRRGRPKKTDSPQSVPPPVEAEKPPQVIPQNLVRDIVKELKDKNYSNDMIKDILQKSTGGKKGGWDNNDAPAIRKFVEELEAKKTESALQQTTDEVEKFLKEQQQ